ncbi:MAG: hypothetical protein P8Y93_07605 [Acidobacteriota bacterium]
MGCWTSTPIGSETTRRRSEDAGFAQGVNRSDRQLSEWAMKPMTQGRLTTLRLVAADEGEHP